MKTPDQYAQDFIDAVYNEVLVDSPKQIGVSLHDQNRAMARVTARELRKLSEATQRLNDRLKKLEKAEAV